jgi:hypothetical protein
MAPAKHVVGRTAACTLTLGDELVSEEVKFLTLEHWIDALTDSLSLVSGRVEDLPNVHYSVITMGTSNLVEQGSLTLRSPSSTDVTYGLVVVNSYCV